MIMITDAQKEAIKKTNQDLFFDKFYYFLKDLWIKKRITESEWNKAKKMLNASRKLNIE